MASYGGALRVERSWIAWSSKGRKHSRSVDNVIAPVTENFDDLFELDIRIIPHILICYLKRVRVTLNQ